MAASNISVIPNMTIDFSNPPYLYHSDHPGMILVSKFFDGTGFGDWKRAMTIALSAKNKLGFINNTLTMSDNEQQLANDMMISWILSTLTGDIANGAKIYQLQKNLCQITQGSSDIANYFAKMKSNWDELNAINTIPSCTCGATHFFAKRDEDQRLIQFLPLPINRAYGILMQDEKQKEIHATPDFTASSTSMNARSRDFKFTKEKKFANLAEDQGKSDQSQSEQQQGLTRQQYHDVMALLQQSKVQLGTSTTYAANSATTINQDSFRGIMSCNSSKYYSKWITNTGANDHMCHDENLLSSVSFIKNPIFITLPNGTCVTVHQHGIVPLTDNISLSNVLSVSQFRNNLLSVSRLCSDTNGIVLFSKTIRVLHVPSRKSP
ncbi:uncharacterized protein LOC143548796 [Bidens hawaiensis]|uniref:uncharacterized protein LOC143548796 n=1 Tax=Bidens hawaiensis TaxID=980011 RepID=UPI00404A9ED1